MIPTPNAIIRLFTANISTEAERDGFKYLKQYVRGANEEYCKKFMHFVTGSDIILVSSIKISFIAYTSKFSKRPIAHTCEPLLEIPVSYNNFCELRHEFENILSASSWEMDWI